MNLYEMFDNSRKLTLVDALRDFLPLAVKHLKLTALPNISFSNNTQYGNQASFGCYDSETDTIKLAIINRQPVDILRTLAHELAHASQRSYDELDADSWRTGSPEENEANAAAGVIMRLFAKKYPQYLTLPAVAVPNKLDEKRKRKRKSKSKQSASGYYGYYWGGVNNSTEHGDVGGDGGGGESMNESVGKTALVGVLAAALSMVPAPSQAEPSDAAKALSIYRTVNRYKDYDRAALEGEANQELMNILRSIQGHPNQSRLLPIIKKMITSDDSEELPPLTSEPTNEAWSEKYKRSINCNNPKGFSQRAHCQGRKKNEAVEPHEPGYQHDVLTMPQNTLVIDTPGELDWYKIGQHFPNLGKEDPHEYGQSESDMVITFASPEEMAKFAEVADRLGLKVKNIGGTQEHPEIHAEPKMENFADGKKPGRKGLAKRVGVDCSQSISKLRSIAKSSSGERQRMAHWCANMKSGRNK